jgi:hypothetical protein
LTTRPNRQPVRASCPHKLVLFTPYPPRFIRITHSTRSSTTCVERVAYLLVNLPTHPARVFFALSRRCERRCPRSPTLSLLCRLGTSSGTTASRSTASSRPPRTTPAPTSEWSAGDHNNTRTLWWEGMASWPAYQEVRRVVTRLFQKLVGL